MLPISVCIHRVKLVFLAAQYVTDKSYDGIFTKIYLKRAFLTEISYNVDLFPYTAQETFIQRNWGKGGAKHMYLLFGEIYIVIP